VYNTKLVSLVDRKIGPENNRRKKSYILYSFKRNVQDNLIIYSTSRG